MKIRKISILILAMALCSVRASAIDFRPASASGSGATACAGLSDASAFCNGTAASALTGALPAISGASLTNLNPAALSTPVPIAQGGTAAATAAAARTSLGIVRTFISNSAAGLLPTTTANTFMVPEYGGAVSSTEANTVQPALATGNLGNLFCWVKTAPGASNSYAFTVRYPTTTSTAVTCTISTAATNCTDTTDVVAITAGTTFDILIAATVGGSAPTGTVAACSYTVTY